MVREVDSITENNIVDAIRAIGRKMLWYKNFVYYPVYFIGDYSL